MKYFTWIILILFVAVLIFLGFLIASRVDYFMYEKQVVSFVAKGIQEGAIVRYDGKSVLVNKYNFEVMCGKLLTITEREKIHKVKEYDRDREIIIEVDDRNYVVIMPLERSKAVYMETVLDGKRRYFYVSDKYRLHERVITYSRPEGFYGPNTLLDDSK